MKFGIPTEQAWPYYIPQYKKQPPQRAFTEGLWHQALGAYRCDEIGGSNETTVDNMLRHLNAGLPRRLRLHLLRQPQRGRRHRSGALPQA